jgi:NAD(P)H dehydrogenase (quinone)
MYAITGASGKLGSHVAAQLLARVPAGQVRLGSRQPDRIASFAARGAETVAADFDDPRSLARLFAGRRVVLIISSDAANDRRRAQHKAAFEAARAAGIERIVYTSFTNPGIQSRFTVAASHAESEDTLHALGVPFAILRNNLYAENIMIEAARASGVLAQHRSFGRVACISCGDIAAATVGGPDGAGTREPHL